MIRRGGVFVFPEADPRQEVTAASSALGLPPASAVVTLQGGPTVDTWGYVTCALVWRDEIPHPTIDLRNGFRASPLPLHRFPTAYLREQEPLTTADSDTIDAIVDHCLVEFQREAGAAEYPRGTVFAGSVEAVVPETDGYGGTLRSFPGKALVALSDIGPSTIVIPVLVGTKKQPTSGAADWVYERTVILDGGYDSTIWIMCHEVHTKTRSLATPANLFRGYQEYPMTPHEYSKLIERVTFALKMVAG